MVILVGLTSTATRTMTVVVSNPSLSAYQELQILHSSTLECACSNSTMPYESFVSLSSTFHQICSSDLASEEWVKMLVDAYAGSMGYVWEDKSKKYFEIIASFCKLANETANYNINNFLRQTFATTHVLIERDFNMQLNTTTNQFFESVVTSFSLFVDTTRLLIQVDQPLTALEDSSVTLNTNFNISNDTSQSSTPVCYLVFQDLQFFSL